MKLYLDQESSLNLIRYLRSVNGEDGIGGNICRKRLMNDAVVSTHGIEELEATAHFLLEHAGHPIHALAPERSMATHTKKLVTHVFSQDIPYGSFLDIGHGICICAPQYVFLRLGAERDFIDLIRIGMELCGTYSRWKLPSAMHAPNAAEEQGCTFDVPPVMQARHMRLFLDRMAGHRGAVGARKAAKHVLDGSASPMETAVYLMLCLPKHYGGYGLPKPLLNPKLTIQNPSGTETIERYPDLFWKGPDIDVEYNSDAKHSGEWSRYRDSRREVELTVADVRVLPLTRAQAMDADGFDEFANGLRRMLGIQKRPEDPRWRQRRDDLRRRLLFGLQ
ncbi:MAG: hypothetical protein Q4D27_02415 [Coriobacteriia bacterium]|nr:hypothetical protein [Coriobacteriia bacterium]